MVEHFNKRSLLFGNILLGSFNSVFSFIGSKQIDAASSKSLAMDGFFVPLCNVQLMKSPLFLQGKVKQAIPSSWDPSALARVWTQVYSTAKGYTLNPLVLLTLLEKKYGTIYTFSKSTLPIMYFNSPV
ncbi:hypothetical protein NE237_009819 [Protea cynaroides]|uniref:Uncharacterized protein n=1 Tax=Protea cynaroides TaxID=273540 RepID=A0A9Q0KYM5_9MAGN|nr:hypothetical protein NE237_009819 [Protea cynaroides]